MKQIKLSPEYWERVYCLTDGVDIFEERSMSIMQFEAAQHKAVDATDNNLWWALKDPPR